jgi:hypothetical protein
LILTFGVAERTVGLRNLYYGIAGTLPAYFIFSVLFNKHYATRGGGVPMPTFMDRQQPAGSLLFSIPGAGKGAGVPCAWENRGTKLLLSTSEKNSITESH